MVRLRDWLMGMGWTELWAVVGAMCIGLGEALDNADPAAFGKRIQYVFQDPISSLNPRKTVRQILEAPLIHLHAMPRAQRDARIAEIFDAVSLRAELRDSSIWAGLPKRVICCRSMSRSRLFGERTSMTWTPAFLGNTTLAGEKLTRSARPGSASAMSTKTSV